MTVETDIYSLLAAIGDTSHTTAPDNTDPPYIVYSTRRTPCNALDAAPGLEQVTISIDVHAATPDSARGLANQIKVALQSAAGGGYVTGDQDLYEPEVKLYRVVIDFEVFAAP